MRHLGVTKVEVAVVLAVVAMVLGLLVPAVSKVREAATVSNCKSHLKQFGLAVHNYADTNGRDELPPGCLPGTGNAADRLSWCVAVLPYIEHDDIFRRFNLAAGPNANAAAIIPIRNLRCSKSREQQYPDLHYVGVAGDGPDAATLPADHPRAGAFGYDRVVRFNDFKDGTSNTLMLAEVHTPIGTWATGGPATVRPADLQHIFPARHSEGGGAFQFSKGVALFVMADDSVRSIRAGVSPQVLAALATHSGGEPPEVIE